MLNDGDPHTIRIGAWPPPRVSRAVRVWRMILSIFLAPAYWLMALFLRTPGLKLHLRAGIVGLRILGAPQNRVPMGSAFRLLVSPLDSVRYFEFDALWEWAQAKELGRYLDVSSPRLFPALLLARDRASSGALLNPDMRDLRETEALVSGLGIAPRVVHVGTLIERAPFRSRSFDTITCMSVLEHISNDVSAVRAMWELLAQGGRLLITVPCSRTRSVEHIDHDIYGLQQPVANGLWFWQRFYDESLLRERLFRIAGSPIRMRVYGEIEPGTLRENARRKWTDQTYPFWREPYMMGQCFKVYGSIAEMPGQGVVAMEFARP